MYLGRSITYTFPTFLQVIFHTNLLTKILSGGFKAIYNKSIYGIGGIDRYTNAKAKGLPLKVYPLGIYKVDIFV